MNDLESFEHRPPWMQEAADPQAGEPSRGNGRNATLAAVFAVSTGLLLFLGSTFVQWDHLRFATGPWHGLLVAALPYAPPPFFTYWSVHMLAHWASISPISAVHVLSVAATALFIATVAWILVTATAKNASNQPVHPLFAASFSLLLASHPHTFRALETVEPGLLTAGVALFGIALLLHPPSSRAATFRTLLAGVALGLATANQATFLWVALVALFAYTLFGSTVRPIEGFLGLLLGFALTVTWPLFQSIGEGEPVAFFLSHALEGAAPGLNHVQWDERFLHDWDWSTLLFALTAPIGLGHAIFYRQHAFVFVVLGSLLFMGPLHKTFVAPAETAALLPDQGGPALFALAILAIVGGRGCWFILSSLTAYSGRPWVHQLVGVGFFLLIAGYSAEKLVQPFQDSRPFALAHTAHLPDKAVVVYSDPVLMSYGELQASAREDGTELTLLYRNDFSHWWGRVRLARMPLEDLAWRSMPLSSADLTRWRGELTFYLKDVLPDLPSPSEKHFAGFRLWDFVVQNRHHRPLYFVGAQDSWLAAHAAPAGPLLTIGPDVESLETPDFQAALDAINGLPTAPGIETLSLALSWAARLQGAPEAAIAFADLASEQGDGTTGEAARIRSLARGGDTDAAIDAIKGYWDDSEETLRADVLQGSVQRAIRANKAEKELHAALDQEEGPMYSEDAEYLLSALWEAQELRPLATLFYKASQKNPDDLNALYQLAAIQALMGAYREAEGTLQQWVHRGQFRFGDIDAQLQQDLRFRPFRVYWQGKEDVSDFDALLSRPTHNSLPFRKGLVYP